MALAGRMPDMCSAEPASRAIPLRSKVWLFGVLTAAPVMIFVGSSTVSPGELTLWGGVSSPHSGHAVPRSDRIQPLLGFWVDVGCYHLTNKDDVVARLKFGRQRAFEVGHSIGQEHAIDDARLLESAGVSLELLRVAGDLRGKAGNRRRGAEAPVRIIFVADIARFASRTNSSCAGVSHRSMLRARHAMTERPQEGEMALRAVLNQVLTPHSSQPIWTVCVGERPAIRDDISFRQRSPAICRQYPRGREATSGLGAGSSGQPG